MALKGVGVEKNGFTFYWKIKHFSLCSFLNECSIRSPVFRVEEIDNTEWNMYLYPDFNSNVIFNIQRQDKDDGPKQISVDIKLFLWKTNGRKVTQESENSCFHCTDFLKKKIIQKRSVIFEDKTLFLPDDTLTVGCFIKKHSQDVFVSTECTAYTEIHLETISFAFPFNISLQQQIKTISKTSVSKKYPNFKIILDPTRSINDLENMAVKIVMDNSNINILCKCKLSVKDAKNNTVFLFQGCHKYVVNEGAQSWRLTNSVTSVEKLANVSKDPSFLLRGVLDVSDGKYSSYIKSLIDPVPDFQFMQQTFPNIPTKFSLKEKCKRLYDDSRLCDFTLQVDGEEFSIHKAVLGAVSPVFCAMFELEMKEKQNSVSIIKDIEANTMKKLIHFAYTGKVENLEWDSAIKLYTAADKYQIPELKQYCANWITANLTIENVTEVFTISDMHQDSNLENSAADFVFSRAKEVCRSENWKTFIESNTTIAVKVMQEIFIKFTSNDIL